MSSRKRRWRTITSVRCARNNGMPGSAVAFAEIEDNEVGGGRGCGASVHAIPGLAAIQAGEGGKTGADQSDGFVVGAASRARVLELGGAILVGAKRVGGVMAYPDQMETASSAGIFGGYHGITP